MCGRRKIPAFVRHGDLRRDCPSSRSGKRAKTGGKGIRTPGLLIANETLYQLSYTPVLPMKNRTPEFAEICAFRLFYPA
jgi:hypothetical protein